MCKIAAFLRLHERASKAAYTFNKYWAEQKRMCLGKCTPSCICYSCACIPTDVHMWQMCADSIHLFVIRQEFPLMFAHLPHLVNIGEWWTNMFVHICCKNHTWWMHTFACVWPKTFAKCECGLKKTASSE